MTLGKRFKVFAVLVLVFLAVAGWVLALSSDCRSFLVKKSHIVKSKIIGIKKLKKISTAKLNKEYLIDLLNGQDEQKYWVAGSLPIFPMSDYNNKTKAEIYTLRKEYVEKTMFKNQGYVPNDEVFGLIADKGPWMSIDALSCLGQGTNAHVGLSEESRFVNNPMLLVAVDRIQFDIKPVKMCSPVDYLMPMKLNYSKDENTITSIYELSGYQGNLKEFMLKGLNARDLGFKYAYIEDMDGVNFVNANNISKNVYEFRDFIHLGTACGVKGGCNNGSPRQEELEFLVSKTPAWMFVKLWKKSPHKTSDTADIHFLVIIN